MNIFKTEYSYLPGDPVWFMHDNKISKGVIGSVEVNFKLQGLQLRGYKVRELFNRVFTAPNSDTFLSGFVRYDVNLLDYEKETFRSSSHLFTEQEGKLFPTKEKLIKSFQND